MRSGSLAFAVSSLFLAACSSAPALDDGHDVAVGTEMNEKTPALLAPPPPIHGALSFATGGYADLDYPISNLLDFDEAAISFRAMFQYPNSFYNNVIGQSGNPYFIIGKANGSPYLHLAVGAGKGALGQMYDGTTYVDTPAGKVPAADWIDVVVNIRREAWTTSRWAEFYINGVRVDNCEESTSHSRCRFEDSHFGSGTLRLGMQSFGFGEQFYGLLDNVAVWSKALDAAERSTLLSQRSYPISSNTGLRASWTFDRFNGPAFYSTPNYFGDVRTVPVSDIGETWADREQLTAPNHVTQYDVPMAGTLCMINRIDEGHHAGYASFSTDFVNLNDLPPSACGTANVDGKTQGTPIYAPADGYVVYAYNGSPDNCNSSGCWPAETVPGCIPCTAQDGPGHQNPDCKYPANEIIIRHANGEYTEYLHLENDSIPADILAAFANGEEYLVRRDGLIGRAGSSGSGGDHLHFGSYWRVDVAPPGAFQLRDCGYHMPGGPSNIVTRPFAFSNYWTWNGSSYTQVPRGTPQYLEVFKY